MTNEQMIAKILEYGKKKNQFKFSIGFFVDAYSVIFEFGYEANDSDMIGGFSHATHANLEKALKFIIDEVGIKDD